MGHSGKPKLVPSSNIRLYGAAPGKSGGCSSAKTSHLLEDKDMGKVT